MRTISFTYRSDRTPSGYYCSEPGDQGGEYVPAEVASELLALCEEALEQLQHCDCSNGVTTPMGDRDEGRVLAACLEDRLRAAIVEAK